MMWDAHLRTDPPAGAEERQNPAIVRMAGFCREARSRLVSRTCLLVGCQTS